ncbi:50S ribosomal protein L2 [Candidatus Peribacteria bacterium]|nr:50S ribosomal protein L2 [Candidatus Peribacteria bacterium]
MAIIKIKPTSNGRRNMSKLDYAQLTTGTPSEKRLLKSKKRISGRNQGSISVRHRGGGAKRFIRQIDFSRADKLGIPARVAEIEYDPNRSAFIALLVYADGEKRYSLAHKTMQQNDTVVCDVSAKPVEGNRMQLQHVPVGFTIYNVEMTPNKGGQIARSAGASAKLVSLEGDKAQVELRSGEIRLVEKTNYATIGTVSNEEYNQVRVGKAGRVRHMGRRPQVRGKVMNPLDHPHGGGEASNSIGLKYPKTPWGAHALGVKTRKVKKASDKLIVRTRHRAKARKN